MKQKQFSNSFESARSPESVPTGIPFFLCIAAMFTIIIGYFHYTVEFNEDDLYRVLVGLLNGQATGRWLDDPAQYGIKFGYGYVALVYWLADAHVLTLTPRESLIEAINNIGFAASIVMVALMMASLRAMYGTAVTLFASIVFIFSPLFLEMATCGHQLLIALAFFFAANLLLVIEVPGPWNFATYGAATLLLFVGLTMRAELPIAFSWLAFAQRPRTTSTLRWYIRGVVLRSIVCVAAFAIFLIVLHYGVHTPPIAGDAMSNLPDFLKKFYNPENVMRGAVILVVGCGLATVAAGVVSMVIEAAGIVRGSDRLRALLSSSNLLAPASLILFGVVFWIPNPNPARHFTFVLLGIAVLDALCIVRWFRIGNVGAIAAGIAVVLINQALAEVARPIVLRNLHSVYINFPEHSHTTGAVPLGSFPRHHASLVERYEVITNLARMVTASCEPRILVVTSYRAAIASLLFEPHADTQFSQIMIGSYIGTKVVRNNQTFLFVDPQEIWPRDPVGLITNDTELDGYQIFQDPYSMSADDKSAIPAGRLANYPRLASEMHCGGERHAAN
jgi:hypothetical protein